MRYETKIGLLTLATILTATGCQVSVNGGGSTTPANSPPPTYQPAPYRGGGAPAAAPLPGHHSGNTPPPPPTSYGGRYTLPDGTQVPIISSGNAFGNNQQNSGALRGLVYALPQGTSRLPDLSSMRPIGVVFTPSLNVPQRSFYEGFPGIDNGRNDWFAIRYEATFTVGIGGPYGFRISSDDGSNLYIDGVKQIDDDGLHATGGSARIVYLSTGAHQIRVDYFQGGGPTLALQVFVSGPNGGAERIFTTSI